MWIMETKTLKTIFFFPRDKNKWDWRGSQVQEDCQGSNIPISKTPAFSHSTEINKTRQKEAFHLEFLLAPGKSAWLSAELFTWNYP